MIFDWTSAVSKRFDLGNVRMMLFFLIDGSISNQVGTAQTTRVRSAPLMGYAINRSLKNKDQKDIP